MGGRAWGRWSGSACEGKVLRATAEGKYTSTEPNQGVAGATQARGELRRQAARPARRVGKGVAQGAAQGAITGPEKGPSCFSMQLHLPATHSAAEQGSGKISAMVHSMQGP